MAKECPDLPEEQCNFLKGCLLVTDAIPNGLKTVFCQRWNTQFKDRFDEWNNTVTNGSDFYNNEPQEKRERNPEIFQSILQGDVNSWDYQTLLYATLYSDSFGKDKSDGNVVCGVTSLDEARRQLLQSIHHGIMSSVSLSEITGQIINAFQDLQLAQDPVQRIREKKMFNKVEVLDLYDKLCLERRNLCHFPPSPLHPVINRTKEVANILNELHATEVSKGVSTIYLSGISGCGKSQIAKQVLEKLVDSLKFDSYEPVIVMTLNATTEDTLLDSYFKFAQELLCSPFQLESTAASEGMTTGERIRLVKFLVGSQLQRYAHWFVVIDNVNDFEKLSSYWPEPGSSDWGQGCIIVTSSDLKGIPSNDKYSRHVNLSNGMQPSDAIQLLCQLSSVINTDYALEVAELLEFQPLALFCASAYMGEIAAQNDVGPSWKDYVEKFERKRQCCREENDHFPQSHSEICRAAIELLVEALLKNDSELSDVFCLMSIFTPGLVRNTSLSQCLETIEAASYERVLTKLKRTPFLAVTVCGKVSSIVPQHHNFQSMIECEVRKPFIMAVLLATLWNAIKNLPLNNGVLSGDAYHLALNVEMFMHHVETLNQDQHQTLLESLVKLLDTDLIRVFFEIGKLCHRSQRLESAKKCYSLAKGIAENENSLESSSSELLESILFNQGSVCKASGDSDAVWYFEQSLKHREARSGKCHPSVAEVMDSIGDCYMIVNDANSAQKYYQEAYNIRLQVLGEDHRDIATSWRNLGSVYALNSDFLLAKELYEKAMSHHSFHQDVAKDLTCIGVMSACTGDFELARRHLEQAIEIEESLRSKYHPCLLSNLKNVINACKMLKDTDAAEKYLKQALEIAQRVSDDLDEEAARFYSEIGSLRAAREDWETAKEHYEKALKIRENVLCELHSEIADSCCDLGNAYRNLGDLEAAKSLYERSLGTRGLLFESSHPDIGTSYFLLGVVYTELGDSQTGSSLLQRAVEIRFRAYGMQHPETAASLYQLGNSFARLGHLNTARDLFQDVAAVQEKLFGESNAQLAKTASSLAHVCSGLGDLECAKQQYRRAVAIHKKVSGENHVEVAAPLLSLALVHEHCKEVTEAKTLLEEALSIYKKSTSGHSQILKAEMHLKRVISKLPQTRCVVM